MDRQLCMTETPNLGWQYQIPRTERYRRIKGMTETRNRATEEATNKRIRETANQNRGYDRYWQLTNTFTCLSPQPPYTPTQITGGRRHTKYQISQTENWLLDGHQEYCLLMRLQSSIEVGNGPDSGETFLFHIRVNYSRLSIRDRTVGQNWVCSPGLEQIDGFETCFQGGKGFACLLAGVRAFINLGRILSRALEGGESLCKLYGEASYYIRINNFDFPIPERELVLPICHFYRSGKRRDSLYTRTFLLPFIRLTNQWRGQKLLIRI